MISPLVKGELHVLFHPVYNIPTPYLKLWRSTGEILGLEEVQSIIDGAKDVHCSDIHCEDARYYEFGRLTIESHPFLDKPYCTLHVCMLEDRLKSVMDQHEGTKCSSDALYLLVWFSVVGPFVGFPVSAEAFVKAQEQLLQQKS